nr:MULTISPECIES: DUF3298 and DUF4163 domain-containing protein [unclassified Paenibacillus]
MTRFPVPIQTVQYRTPLAEIYYPRVWGVPQAAAQERMNRQIESQVQELIREQRGYQVQGQTSITGLFELKTNERGVLSLSQSNYAYTPPMAHGMTLLKSLTFDVTTAKAYSLGELFKPGSDYVAALSEIVRSQIKARDLTLLGEFKGIAPDQDYYIADKALVIYFQLYEITAYVYGFPMFPISVYELQELVTEDGPLGRMIPGV